MSTTELNFGRKSLADAARETLDPDALDHDDARRATVTVDTDDVDEYTLDRLTGEAADARVGTVDPAGQTPLTGAERERIDFTETTVPTARSAKAIFQREGVEDWTAYFDPTLSVDEHRDIARRAKRDERGQRMDTERDPIEQFGRAHRRAEREAEDHALEHAASDPDARDFLLERGWTPAEIDDLTRPGPDLRQPASPAEARAVDIIRSRANGRYLREPPAPAPDVPGSMRSATTGRLVGNRFADPAIGRDPRTGRFVPHGEADTAGPYPGQYSTDPILGEPEPDPDVDMASEYLLATDAPADIEEVFEGVGAQGIQALGDVHDPIYDEADREATFRARQGMADAAETAPLAPYEEGETAFAAAEELRDELGLDAGADLYGPEYEPVAEELLYGSAD